VAQLPDADYITGHRVRGVPVRGVDQGSFSSLRRRWAAACLDVVRRVLYCTGTVLYCTVRVSTVQCTCTQVDLQLYVLYYTYMGNTLPGAAILCNYCFQLFSVDTSIHESHDPSMETREDTPGRQFAGFRV
jgi:hypothetical protein